jgi:molecular chaperone DnaK (HSP70)
MAGEGPAIGIDLGTTYSCVGVWQHDRVEIIANDQGNRTTPSYVAFTDTERLIGDAAKNQVAMNPQNTVFGKYCFIAVAKSIRRTVLQVAFVCMNAALSVGATDAKLRNCMLIYVHFSPLYSLVIRKNQDVLC